MRRSHLETIAIVTAVAAPLLAAGASCAPRYSGADPSTATASPAPSASVGAPVADSWTPPAEPNPKGPEVRAACGPIAAVFDDPTIHSFDQAEAMLDVVAAHPPAGVSPAQAAWCKAQIKRLIGVQMAFEANAEGYRAIAKIARGLQSAFAKKKALCPAAKPIPSALAEPGARTPPGAEWTSDDGWTCVGFAPDEPQLFQYELAVAGDEVAIVARRRIAAEIVSITLKGRVDASGLAFAPDVVESRAPAAR